MVKKTPAQAARLLLPLSLTLSLWAAAQMPSIPLAPIPKIGAPGQVQPVAPGTRPAPVLPTLTLVPAMPEVRKVETITSGPFTGAHALILVPGKEVSSERVRTLAREATLRSYRAKPDLNEVDVSIYRAESYRGFGGPLPILTVSVPRDRLEGFAAEWDAGTYDRTWTAPNLQTPEPEFTPIQELERLPVFIGTEAELLKQRVEQALGILHGGVRGGVIYRGNTHDKRVALTVDDVPHPMYFPVMLDVLRRENAHATFFIIGRNAEAYPYFIKDLVKDGHELGNHTFHHVRLPRLTDAQIIKELKSTNDLLTKLTGQPVHYFRPPGGEISPRVLSIAQSLGLTTVFWTDDPADFQNPGVTTVEERYARFLRSGGIILLHDNAPDGLMALPDLMKVAHERGFSVDTVGNFDK